MLQQFREFALRGNVVDLAVGVVIGVAFGKIVDSMVGDIFMPIIGWITGGLDFSNYFLALGKDVTAISYTEAKKQGAVVGFGQFVTIAVNFLIVAWVLFLVVKGMNNLKRSAAASEAAAPAPAPSAEITLLSEIRDLLASQSVPKPAPAKAVAAKPAASVASATAPAAKPVATAKAPPAKPATAKPAPAKAATAKAVPAKASAKSAGKPKPAGK